MHLGQARMPTIGAILAFSALGASSGATAQTGSDVGPMSRATVRIQVSVAERAGLRTFSAKGVPAPGPCIYSMAKARTFAVMLEPLGRSGAGPALPQFGMVAARAGQSCKGNESLRKALAALGKDGSPGPYLLIISPQ
jgi:hypothetical protein